MGGSIAINCLRLILGLNRRKKRWVLLQALLERRWGRGGGVNISNVFINLGTQMNYYNIFNVCRHWFSKLFPVASLWMILESLFYSSMKPIFVKKKHIFQYEKRKTQNANSCLENFEKSINFIYNGSYTQMNTFW